MKKVIFIIGFCLVTLFVSANNRVARDTLAYNYLQDTTRVIFYFEFDKIDLNINYMSNRTSLEQLDKKFADTSWVSNINDIVLITSASPDGNYNYNLALTNKRELALELMLLERYPPLRKVMFVTNSYIPNWSKLQKLIEQDFEMPWRSDVLSTIAKDRDSGAIW